MQGNIPVVQGFSVSSPQHHQSDPHSGHYTKSDNYGSEFNGERGEQQPNQFNDVFFSILFFAHLIVMGVLLASTLSNGGGGQGGIAYGMVYFCSVCGIFATGLSTVTLGFMMQFATSLIKAALYFQIASSLMIAIAGLLSGQIFMGVLACLGFAVSICYAYAVWDRIPFAAANLNTALTAVKTNLGVAAVAYFFLFLGFGWTIWWSVVAGDMMANYGAGVAFLFFLSYYWTQQVLSNTVHVTTSGVIGTWWFAPHEASSCCSKAIGVSLSHFI